MSDNKIRCTWCQGDAVDEHYHDTQWGVPIHEDHLWFECITLEGAQAGLSWRTIVNKIEGYQQSFQNFNIEKVAKMTDAQLDKLLKDPKIVRNRLKVYSTRNNAQQMLKVQHEFSSFNNYIWGFVNHKPIVNTATSLSDIPTTTNISDAMSKDLKKRGFKFVGSTICYALMQAAGMVNDHEIGCFRYEACTKLGNDTQKKTEL
ncbi:DNA-3-methyladenine glycosylase [hydrothermal vent metagenome]|uniref:DNA-3-methyladenine glycosylase n=1 Tax=hydrothermal vent metagenome TaxID=652676 RepID=A0A3B0V3L0_9ZZZZ